MSFADSYDVKQVQKEAIEKIHDYIEKNDLNLPDMELKRFEVDTQPEYHGLVFVSVEVGKRNEKIEAEEFYGRIRRMYMILKHGSIWGFDSKANKWLKGRSALKAKYLNSI